MGFGRIWEGKERKIENVHELGGVVFMAAGRASVIVLAWVGIPASASAVVVVGAVAGVVVTRFSCCAGCAETRAANAVATARSENESCMFSEWQWSECEKKMLYCQAAWHVLFKFNTDWVGNCMRGSTLPLYTLLRFRPLSESEYSFFLLFVSGLEIQFRPCWANFCGWRICQIGAIRAWMDRASPTAFLAQPQCSTLTVCTDISLNEDLAISRLCDCPWRTMFTVFSTND